MSNPLTIRLLRPGCVTLPQNGHCLDVRPRLPTHRSAIRTVGAGLEEAGDDVMTSASIENSAVIARLPARLCS
jgi:hypothetical protein